MTIWSRIHAAWWWFLQTFWYWLPVLTPVLFILAIVILWILGHPFEALGWLIALGRTYL